MLVKDTKEFQDGLKLIEAMKSRSVLNGVLYKRQKQTFIQKLINLFKI